MILVPVLSLAFAFALCRLAYVSSVLVLFFIPMLVLVLAFAFTLFTLFTEPTCIGDGTPLPCVSSIHKFVGAACFVSNMIVGPSS